LLFGGCFDVDVAGGRGARRGKDHKRAADELETYLKLEPKASDAERIRAAIKDLRSKQ
jgi:regulator of sirC expression with transglutaminase-like and TPR domain